jgi:WD40 repeat protein/tRNA A-37 threonylcarbamoyl transferase component Bud32
VAVPGYELLGVLGKGAMGVVYQARQVGLGRVVAVKMLLAGELASPAERARFRTEAQALARLSHPNIVQVYQVGEHDGHLFLCMEYCAGGSLAERLAGNPLPPAAAAQLAQTLARAVQAAHDCQVIHRDLKPGNVLLAGPAEPGTAPGEAGDVSSWGTPKVSDFGLARKLDESVQTASGALLGTPSYMAPEQARGRGKEVGPSADVYALGAILYEQLTGRPPFKAATALDTVLQVVSDEPVSVRRLQPKVPRDLETVCLKCLEKDPRKRYASALDLAEDLRRFQAGEAVTARPAGPLGRAVRWARRRPAVATMSGVVVAAVLSVLALSVVMAITFREAAQRDRERLFESLVSQAQAERRAGDRKRSLELLAEAANMRPSDRVRQELIQTITSAGARFLSEMPSGEGRERGEVFSPVFSPDGKLVAFTGEESFPVGPAIKGPHGGVLQGETSKPVLNVREFPSGKLLAKRSDFYTPLRFRPTTSHVAIAKNFAGPITYLWDPVAGKDLGTFPGANPVFSANGAWLATTNGKQVRIWDLTENREAKPPSRGTPLQFLSQRELLLADDGIYRRWDFTLGQETFATPKWLVGVGVSANGRLAVLHDRPTNQSGEAITVWDLIEGKQVAALRGVGFVPSSVTFSPDEKQLALKDSFDEKMTILVWDLATGRFISRLSSRGLQSSSGLWDQLLTWGSPAPSFSPSGAFLAARGFRGSRPFLCLWDVETGAEVKILPGVLYSWWSNDDRGLVTLGRKPGDEDRAGGGIRVLVGGEEKHPPSGCICLWEVIRATPTYLLDASIQRLLFNEDGSRIAANDAVWDVNKNTQGYFLRRSPLSTSGSFPVFVGREDVWASPPKPRDGVYATLERLTPEKRKYVLPRPAYPEIDKSVRDGLLVPEMDFGATHVTLSPDGKQALIASGASFFPKRGGSGIYASPLELWDPIGGKRLAFWNQSSYKVDTNEPGVHSIEEWKCLQFSPDGKRVATSSSKALKIWDVSRGEVEKTLIANNTDPEVPKRVVDQLTFSRDGK